MVSLFPQYLSDQVIKFSGNRLSGRHLLHCEPCAQQIAQLLQEKSQLTSAVVCKLKLYLLLSVYSHYIGGLIVAVQIGS